MTRVLLRVLAIALFVAVGLGAAVARAVWEGRAALAAGDDALARGDRAAAVANWREAAAWAAPIGDHQAVARAMLAEHGAAPTAPTAPADAGWVAAALAGLALVIAGAVQFARRAIAAGDRLIAREAAGAGALVAVGLLLWLIGLRQA